MSISVTDLNLYCLSKTVDLLIVVESRQMSSHEEVHHKVVDRQTGVVQMVDLLVAHGASFQLSNGTKRISTACKFHISLIT